MKSRWPTRVVCAGLALWYARFGLARRKPPVAPMRILIVQNFLLGDSILLAPLLKKLRACFPAAQIVMTCKRAFLPIFATRPYGVDVLPFDPRDIASFFPLFRRRGFDLALLPADNRFAWIARALDSRWIVAFEGDRPAYKNLLIDEFRPFPDHAMGLGDLFAQCLVEGPDPLPFEKTDWPAPPADAFDLPPAPYVVLHVGASTRLRNWEPEKWRELIAHLRVSGITPVISSGPGEEELVAGIDPQKRNIAYPGLLSLPQIWRLLAGASVVVCPDTGVGHLARIAGAPTVVLFGPGSATLFGGGEFWRSVPGRKVNIPAFPCRDENRLFRRHLPWAEHCGRTVAQCASRNAVEVASPRCMHALTAQMAIDAVDALLAQTAFKPGE
jgi:ADP-heptose:LPS heptosyltransferase